MQTHETNSHQRVVALVKDGDQFEAVIAPTLRASGIHELRLLWNRRPFITRVFQRDTLENLMAWVAELREDLVSRGWRDAHPQNA